MSGPLLFAVLLRAACDARARGSARSNEAAGRVCRSELLGGTTGDAGAAQATSVRRTRFILLAHAPPSRSSRGRGFMVVRGRSGQAFRAVRFRHARRCGTSPRTVSPLPAVGRAVE